MTDLPDLLYVVPTGGLIPAGTPYWRPSLDGKALLATRLAWQHHHDGAELLLTADKIDPPSPETLPTVVGSAICKATDRWGQCWPFGFLRAEEQWLLVPDDNDDNEDCVLHHPDDIVSWWPASITPISWPMEREEGR